MGLMFTDTSTILKPTAPTLNESRIISNKTNPQFDTESAK
jgi:hypothetical protein